MRHSVIISFKSFNNLHTKLVSEPDVCKEYCIILLLWCKFKSYVIIHMHVLLYAAPGVTNDNKKNNVMWTSFNYYAMV